MLRTEDISSHFLLVSWAPWLRAAMSFNTNAERCYCVGFVLHVKLSFRCTFKRLYATLCKNKQRILINMQEEKTLRYFLEVLKFTRTDRSGCGALQRHSVIFTCCFVTITNLFFCILLGFYVTAKQHLNLKCMKMSAFQMAGKQIDHHH